jgi:uncharacterized protein
MSESSKKKSQLLPAGLVFGSVIGLSVLGWFLWSGYKKAQEATVSHVPVPPVVLVSTEENEQAMRDAALDGLIQSVLSLLKQGTNPDAADAEGRRALMYAAYNGHDNVIRAILPQVENVNAQDAGGLTALMYAASGANAESVRLLLEAKADSNMVDNGEHFTALMYAAAEGQVQVVKVLLKAGADATLKDIDGESALDFATNNGHTEVVKILEPLEEKTISEK